MRTSQNTKQRKKEKTFVKYMQEKLAITVLVITLALFALVLVLYNLIKNKNEDYTQIVLSQQSYDSRVIPYRRGDVLDRNGTYLATSEKVYNLIIDPKQILSDKTGSCLETTIGVLSECFGYDRQELITMIQEKSDLAYVRHARRLSFDEKDSFEKRAKDINSTNSKNGAEGRVRGVWFEDEYKRIYPYSSLACNVIGFSSGDGSQGTGGIEQFYNSSLIGTNGREYGYLNDESNLERVIKSASNGNTVVSTIDVNVQSIAEKYITDWQTQTGSERVGVIVMNPNNGEILAMATDSSFDLNDPRNLTGIYSQEDIDAMDEKTQMEAWNKMWRNFCVSDTYEPGSPAKVFTVAAGLEEGILSGNEHFLCDGYQEVGGWRIRCVNRNGHGDLSVTESLMVSCNDALMQMAAMIGTDRFIKYQNIFGFGTKTGVDLPGEAETSSLIHTVGNMGSTDLATNSFGQNYNCTMIQMAAAYCSIINGGAYYEPRVVKQILNDQGAVVEKKEPNLVRETVSENTSSFLKQALFRTVAEGTGKAAGVMGYEIGGKTGTAEKYPRGQGNYLVSFAGFAPINNPQVFVYVIIDTPHVEDQAHSSYASGVFANIMKDILPYLNVFPTGETADVSQDVQQQLPSEEGITDHSETLAGTEETASETKVYQQDEYITPEVNEAGETVEDPLDLPGEPLTQESMEGSTDYPLFTALPEDIRKVEERP